MDSGLIVDQVLAGFDSRHVTQCSSGPKDGHRFPKAAFMQVRVLPGAPSTHRLVEGDVIGPQHEGRASA